MRCWFAKSQKSAMLWLKRVQGRRPRAHVKNLAGERRRNTAHISALMKIYNATTLGQEYSDPELFYQNEVRA